MCLDPILQTLYKMYYNRLKINIVRNGLTFMEDIRDRQRWTAELYRTRETAVMEEIPEEIAIDNMVGYMKENGYESDMMYFTLLNITGKRWSFDNSNK